ncbi:GGDEF domain-containing protein [soil metagenome]
MGRTTQCAQRSHGALSKDADAGGTGLNRVTRDDHGPETARQDIGVRSYGTFEEASRSVLRYLHATFEMGLWFVSRTVGDQYIILVAEGSGFEIGEGAVMPWADSMCARLLTDGTAQAAPRVDERSDLLDVPVVDALGIGAYLGAPLYTHDGEFFGTLGAIDGVPHDMSLLDALPVVELLGGLLMTVLETELRVDVEQQRAELERDAALTDALCGIPNRRAWNDAVEREESRCRRYGEPAGVVIVDLDRLKVVNDERGHAAGDELLHHTARVLGSVVRDSDLVARLGGDEFGVLAAGASSDDLSSLVQRIDAALQVSEIAASLGACTRRPDMTLLEAWHSADREMYRHKARKERRSRAVGRSEWDRD